MNFFKGLLPGGGRHGGDDELDREALQRDLAEGGFESPLLNRAHEDPKAVAAAADDEDWPDDDEAFFDEDDEAAIAPDGPEPAAEPEPEPAMAAPAPDPEPEIELEPKPVPAEPTLRVTVRQAAPTDEAEDDYSWFDDFDDDDDEPEDWNIGLAPDSLPEAEPDTNQDVIFEEPDNEDNEEIYIGMSEEEPVRPASRQRSGALALNEDLEFEPDEAEDIEQAALEAVQTQENLSADEKQGLIDEIRLAMKAVGHIRSDQEAGRLSAARDELGKETADDRILDATNTILAEDVGARRRQAIALMKAAAEATRADPVLQDMAGRDPTADPVVQRDYRNDLADMEPPALEPTRSRMLEEQLRAAAPELAADDTHQPDAATLHDDDDADEMDFHADKDADTEDADIDMSGFEEDDDNGKPLPVGASGNAAADGLRAALLAARSAPEAIETEPETMAPGPDEDMAAAETATATADDDFDWTKTITAAFDDADPEPEPMAAAPLPNVVAVPGPAMGRAGRGAGRVKTRLLGFHGAQGGPEDVFDREDAPAASPGALYPVGWLVVSDGPGRGHAFALTGGVSQIGRGEGQAVRLDFGDGAISRQNHAAIAFDDEQNRFYLGHGGKSNLVRLNGKPVLATEELQSQDEIRLGETRLKFIALCGDDFSWQPDEEGSAGHAAIA